MNMIQRFVLFILLMGSSLALKAQTVVTISHQQAEADVAALRRILYRDHPAPTAYITRDSLDKRLAALLPPDAASIPLKQWEIGIRELLISVGCGHTYVGSNPRVGVLKNPKILPMKVFSTDDRMWVVEGLDSAQAQAIPAGAQLVRLNDKPVSEVLKRYMNHQSSDGYNQSLGRRLINKDLFFNYLYRKYFFADTVVNVAWLDSLGEEHSSVVQAVPDRQLKPISTVTRDSSIRILYSTGKGKQYFYVHPDNPKVGVLRISSFRGKGNKLYRRAFRYMRRHAVDHLVIDVRDNLGGSFSSSVTLAQYLVDSSFSMRLSRPVFRTWRHQPFLNHPRRVGSFLMFDVFNPNPRWIKKGRVHYRLKYKPKRRWHYEGHAYVLINGFSFSASSLMAAYANERSSAIMIGQETGGGARSNNGMQIPLFKLPGSGIRLRIPQMNLDYRLGKDYGRGVWPDIATYPTIETVRAGRDLEWEAVWMLVKKAEEQ
jgi:Peptidase family S41